MAIYQVETRRWDYFLVGIGAHDHSHHADGGKVQKANRLMKFQFKSWYDPSIMPGEEGYNLIGQIFFSGNDRAIDETSDRIVLEYLAKVIDGNIASRPNQKIELAFIGYADPSGSASYNDVLSLKRAMAVQDFVQRQLNKKRNPWARTSYRSQALSYGETRPTINPDLPQQVNYAANRRVDIVWKGQRFKFPGETITMDYKGPPPEPKDRPVVWTPVEYWPDGKGPTISPPGVDRNSRMPTTPHQGFGNSNNNVDRIGGAAKLVQWAAYGSRAYANNRAKQRALERVGDNVSFTFPLKPVGPHVGVVVAIRLQQYEQDKSELYDRQEVIGYGADPKVVIDAWYAQPRLVPNPEHATYKYEFFWGTRQP